MPGMFQVVNSMVSRWLLSAATTGSAIATLVILSAVLEGHGPQWAALPGQVVAPAVILALGLTLAAQRRAQEQSALAALGYWPYLPALTLYLLAATCVLATPPTPRPAPAQLEAQRAVFHLPTPLEIRWHQGVARRSDDPAPFTGLTPPQPLPSPSVPARWPAPLVSLGLLTLWLTRRTRATSALTALAASGAAWLLMHGLMLR